MAQAKSSERLQAEAALTRCLGNRQMYGWQSDYRAYRVSAHHELLQRSKKDGQVKRKQALTKTAGADPKAVRAETGCPFSLQVGEDRILTSR